MILPPAPQGLFKRASLNALCQSFRVVEGEWHGSNETLLDREYVTINNVLSLFVESAKRGNTIPFEEEKKIDSFCSRDTSRQRFKKFRDSQIISSFSFKL